MERTRIEAVRASHRPPLAALVCIFAIIGAGLGCFGFRAVNQPLAQFDPDYGYRPSRADIRRERGKIAVYLAFSGGGTRAAALAYGVMEGLEDTLIERDGETVTMLDEVDTISGVSGGSFPAAYYGLFGNRIFDDFEPRFLRRNIQGTIIRHALIPWNAVRLFTPWLSRSDIAEKIYDESVFDRATFETLTNANGPIIYINATDLSSGDRFTFVQGQFDLICSDLQALPIAYAVAASSAVPMLLSPISMRNNAGTCGYVQSELIDEALANRLTNPRQYRAARSFSQLQDPSKKFLHLVDGGISDNLGLRAGLDILEVTNSLQRTAEMMNAKVVDTLVVISVNAETDPDPSIDLSSAAPGFASMMNAVSGGQIRRINFDTLLLTQELVERLARESRDAGFPVETFLVAVDFEDFAEKANRRYFKRIPTSFNLSDDQVDELIWAGRDLLLASSEYRRLVGFLGGQLPERKPRPDND